MFISVIVIITIVFVSIVIRLYLYGQGWDCCNECHQQVQLVAL